MKKVKLIIAAILTVVGINLNAQSTWSITSISLSTGETPLTKGITLTGAFEKGNHLLVMDYNSEIGEVMYFYTPKKVKWVSFGHSVGFFKNTMWTGPIASLTLFEGHFKTLNWMGVSFGNPEIGNTSEKIDFLFSYQQFAIILGNVDSKIQKGNVEIYYVLQHYQKNLPEHIFGTKANIPLNSNLKLFGGVAYMKVAEKYLWSMGVNYNF